MQQGIRVASRRLGFQPGDRGARTRNSILYPAAPGYSRESESRPRLACTRPGARRAAARARGGGSGTQRPPKMPRAHACLSFGLCPGRGTSSTRVCVRARARAGALMFKIFAILIFSLIMLVIFGT